MVMIIFFMSPGDTAFPSFIRLFVHPEDFNYGLPAGFAFSFAFAIATAKQLYALLLFREAKESVKGMTLKRNTNTLVSAV